MAIDTERFVQFIAEAQERLSSCDDGSAFAQSVYTDLQTLEAMLETGPVSTMNQLANMISDKLTMLENDNAPQAVPDKSALQTLLGETLNENEYSEQSWNKYAQALDYGSTIYYHAGADQALVDYACARIEEAKAGLSMRNYYHHFQQQERLSGSCVIQADRWRYIFTDLAAKQPGTRRLHSVQFPGTVSPLADRHLFCQCRLRYLASWQSGDLRRWQ